MDPFTLTTYNIHCFPWTNPAIKDIVAWIIQHSGTDIAALQEVWHRHDEWAAAFAAHGWSVAHPAREGHIATIFGSGLMVAWSTRKWRLTDSRFYPFLEATGTDQLAAKGWFRTEFQQIRTRARLRLINTHMQSDYDVWSRPLRPITETVRRIQVAQLLEVETRTQPELPTLVVGDMNTDQCWFPGGWLLPPDHGPLGITFPSAAESLDHCTGLGTIGWIVKGVHISRLDLSDHYPVSWLLCPQLTSSRVSVSSPSQLSPVPSQPVRGPAAERP